MKEFTNLLLRALVLIFAPGFVSRRMGIRAGTFGATVGRFYGMYGQYGHTLIYVISTVDFPLTLPFTNLAWSGSGASS